MRVESWGDGFLALLGMTTGDNSNFAFCIDEGRCVSMKKWLCERFLPLWAKETILRENRNLRAENAALTQKVRELEAYIKGVHKAMRNAEWRVKS